MGQHVVIKAGLTESHAAAFDKILSNNFDETIVQEILEDLAEYNLIEETDKGWEVPFAVMIGW
ncbi:hypothetical protein CL653_03475 [bacterium]|nr:hypothetical protein [bacterium]|tara:strand:- start:827 stop:1015 length:189 start_codon:yes stop_codon:yes gene_type:complete